ncbi:sugar transferase [Xenorhabdus nematophila]|uniref:sugar transferase n=1 Tax=Xenorhabdus nematophila TaxID=628 RepID=UPI0003275A08|nr:sugar transferase [Xenorhabdus nematophila]CEF30267.1 Undecaprenyl-phosphate galactose phosphotransferase [Xenorhabdus nematophila str. Websteri]AYA41568.1 sugar transferase [Xenorhabdus nematophila]KHD27994.1 sugar transferase [Xenorhabdus nematophila]MBA0020306.1 sugar transferase [Xenorhabdus nematophila]MCB4426091.1 sugar transferase [Xenorhabdus nematophila]
MKKSQIFLKRTFDIILSTSLIVIVFPIIFIGWLISTIETRSNGFFIQKRIGQNGREFSIIKIKTMQSIVKNENRPSITSENSQLITKSGRFFRKYKIDELSQLINVLIGNMSFVGPRPDVPGYADKLTGDDRVILKLKPGITGPASIKYKNEEELLKEQPNPKEYNDLIIWPDKVRINKEYYLTYSLLKDIKYIIHTLK